MNKQYDKLDMLFVIITITVIAAFTTYIYGQQVGITQAYRHQLHGISTVTHYTQDGRNCRAVRAYSITYARTCR